MTLEDLLVSYNEVKPEELDNLEQKIPQFFQPLEIKNFSIKEDSSKQKPSTSDQKPQPLWYFADYAGSPLPGIIPTKPQIEQISEPQIKYTRKSQTKQVIQPQSIKINTDSSGNNYKVFKAELNKFIQNNPEYKDLEQYLNGIAKLESSYNQFAINKKSNALGWFQFLDSTRKDYNKQSRKEFSRDAQAQFKAASQHLTSLRKQIKSWGGDDTDFPLLYAAWWNPSSVKSFIKNPNYDWVSPHGERFSTIYNKAKKLTI